MTMENDPGQPDASASLLAFFGRQVLKQRTERDWSQQELAKEAHTTGAMISYVENAKRVPPIELAGDLDAAFKTTFFTEFHPLVVRYAYPTWFLPFIELERDAVRHRVFESQIVPGLLQTEEYARAMLAAVRPDNLDDLVAARLSRQAILERDTPPHTWFIMDEQALRRTIGGPAVMAAQLEHLLLAGQAPRTVVQVMPEKVTAHPGLAGPFTLLSFDHGGAPKVREAKPPHDVLYVDGFSQGRTALETAEVMAAGHAYDLLTSYALSPDESEDLIRDHLKGLTA
ncbi:Scr1 family TA system antitoxin-like transcriptional regulator [Streptomyces sp. NPDC001549]|uniref:helix-turn-helix domain-containing protein n=1 Tax=Streptomyces sp. NPDC001549 TaxID=3364586 RepID=UPI00367B6837